MMAARNFEKRVERLEKEARVRAARMEEPETEAERIFENAKYFASTLQVGMILQKRKDAGQELTVEEETIIRDAKFIARTLGGSSRRPKSYR